MLIKVGDRIIDPSNEPVSIFLADQDKENIAKMLPECHFYTMFPEEISDKEMDAFIADFKERISEHGQHWANYSRKGLYSEEGPIEQS